MDVSGEILASGLPAVAPKKSQFSEIDDSEDPKRGRSLSGHRNILDNDSMSNFASEALTFKALAEEEEKLSAKLSACASDTDLSANQDNRFLSYAPVRDNCHAHWFVDGKDYFAHLADSLEQAESEIFITDWSLNPELFLRREHGKATAEDRLDRILLKRAVKGVMIYVLVWFETQQAMQGTVNSLHTLEALENLHPNVRVLRHPGGKTKVYWTHHQKTVIIDQRIAYIGGIDLCFGRYDFSSHPLKDDCHLAPIFPGKDYYNPLYQDFTDLERPFIDLIDRTTLPRMPWHDIHCYVDRDAARDIGENFVERWNHHLKKKKASGDSRVRGYPNLEVSSAPFLDAGYPRGTATCQIVRSIGSWSVGLNVKERSIQNAYLQMIENAEHFIYIENQYFISVDNALTDTLFMRVSEAIRKQQTFRVIIIIPVHPCGDWRVPSIKFVMKWQYDTISRGGNSLLERLAEAFPSVDINQYVSFNSLRTVDQLNFTAVSDQIYIHSKLMIVDDRRAIIGSANWNDRSMNGDRDSEICIIVEDNQYVESRMNGEFYLASKFAHSLRKNLFMEHLGLEKNQKHLVVDPVISSCYNDMWRATSFGNHHLYVSMFPCLPSDNFLTLSQYNDTEQMLVSLPIETRKERNLTNLKIMSKIKGHLVPYPINFLSNEKLDSGTTIEKVLPPKVFQ